MKNSKAIGLFDSGVGGTSIWKEVQKELPYESTIYLADSANAPYGNRSADAILALSIKNTEVLLDMGCKLIVVACNTATTNAIDYLRSHYNVPFIGIEPAIKPAALNTKTKSIGILATKGTLSSALFHQTASHFTQDVSVVEIIGEGLVPLIEAGELDSPQLIELLHSYMAPMISANIDYLVLGCSHYPYLIPLLTEMLPANVTIIDSGAAVARQTHAVLNEHHLLVNNEQEPTHWFYTNGNIHTLAQLMQSHSEINKIDTLEF